MGFQSHLSFFMINEYPFLSISIIVYMNEYDELDPIGKIYSDVAEAIRNSELPFEVIMRIMLGLAYRIAKVYVWTDEDQELKPKNSEELISYMNYVGDDPQDIVRKLMDRIIDNPNMTKGKRGKKKN